MSAAVPTEPCGVLVLDKPEGPTSHDLVVLARRLLRTRDVGHTGTLDPMATGVLVLCVGRATRLARFLTAGEKVYRARLRLGQATDTYDRTGRPVGPPQAAQVDEARLISVLESLTGRRRQRPPAFSAKRIEGVRSHRLARAGSPRRPQPVEILIHGFRDIRIAGPEVDFEVRCASGTYVRSLAQEVGELLGCGAHLTRLRRTRNGEFTVDQAHPVATLEHLARQDRAADALVPTGRLSLGMAMVRAPAAALERIANGGALQAGEWQGELPAGSELCRVLAPDGSLAAVAAVDPPGAGPPARLLPRIVLLRPTEARPDPRVVPDRRRNPPELSD